MINFEHLFYLETGEHALNNNYGVFETMVVDSDYKNSYVHWLSNKCNDLINMQVEVDKNV